ncbi:hypothetical protein [Sediminibacillus terrae]|uniref:hypothetical protein n=1 Tax=Sediminibacillus terrae TaxID=1562106 RepID=UPI00041E8979|nr:hypothetical protein [Sediminibacillus terrae]
MRIEEEVAAKVYRMRELHEDFSRGCYQEMNDNYSNHFTGKLYMPAIGEVRTFTGEEIKEGNKEAASYYKGKKITFIYSGLQIVPQSDKQAAVSYHITHKSDGKLVNALSLEVWEKEKDGEWRMIRWYEEKGIGRPI